ncbi:MAG TPA: phosphoribosylanthranilate isomerase [Polyangiaceae bacterium]|nr:phosphoribosylanthranilate isomerase [Polyangiaceae bacterium]
MTFVKICGITSVDDALLAIAAGADALGLNFVPSSKRVIDIATATHIVDSVGDLVELIAVVANRGRDELEGLRRATGIRWLQLHGAETPDDLRAVQPEAFKAVAIGGSDDISRAAEYGGERLLLDAKSPNGELGGTGTRFDWSLARPLVESRQVVIAGGLYPDNVAEVIRTLKPFGVDVASGVELSQNPRKKHEGLLRSFVYAVRNADIEP